MTHSVLHLEPGNVKPLAFIYSLEQSLTYSPASSSKCAIIFLLKCFLFEFGSSGPLGNPSSYVLLLCT